MSKKKVSSPQTFQADFSKYINSAARSDVKFLIGKDEVIRYGHSQILAARCPYFEAALQPSWKEGTEGVFRKSNIEPEEFDIILQYIYSGETTLSMENIAATIDAALELQMAELVSHCVTYACQELSPETVCGSLVIASRHNLEVLWWHAIEYFEGIVDVMLQRYEILELEADLLIEILSRNSIIVDELLVWRAVVRYAYHQNGLNAHNCPLVLSPKRPGRLIVEVEAPNGVGGENKDTDSNDEEVLATDASRNEPNDILLRIPQDQLNGLRTTLEPLLSAVRLTGIELVDFRRCIESTGLLTPELCLQLYRYHSLPPEYCRDLLFAPPRSNISTILPRDKLKCLLAWVKETRLSDNPRGSSDKAELPVAKKLYQASRDGFNAHTFHHLCDNKGPTLTIAATDRGLIVGGYSEMSWSSGREGYYASAEKNFLFYSIPEHPQLYRSNLFSKQHATYNTPLHGPVFGNGHDLRISGNGSHSACTASAYSHWHPFGPGLGPNRFNATDYEVFKV